MANVSITALPDSQNPIANKGYSINISSVGTTTWQKAFDQSVSVNISPQLQNLISQSLQNTSLVQTRGARPNTTADISVAIYLIPTSTSGQNSLTPSLPSGLISGTAVTYGLAPKQYGYFIGYVHDYVSLSESHGTNNDPSVLINPNNNKSDIASVNFSWLPAGQYQVYAGIGVTSDATGKSSTAFPIISPAVAVSRIATTNNQRGLSTASIPQPLYSTTLDPLPQSVVAQVQTPVTTRGVPSVTTEYDSILSSVWPATISITPAPNPSFFISSIGNGDVWNPNDSHDVTWISNFKRSYDNNTGLHQYDGIAIVEPYGYNIPASEISKIPIPPTFVVASYYIPVVGPIIGTLLSLANALFGSSAPFAVPVTISAVPTGTTLATACLSQSLSICKPSYPLGSGYLESAKISVSPDKIAKLQSGTYYILASAQWSSAPAVIATSSMFTILSIANPTSTPAKNSKLSADIWEAIGNWFSNIFR